jgi:hypothetical protein
MSIKSTLIRASLIALAVASTMFTSCIKDDRTDCPPIQIVNGHNVILHVQTDEDAEGRTPSPTFDAYNIDSVVVYIFGEDGKFFDLWSGGAYERGEAYYAELALDPGTYSFAAVTNPSSASDVSLTLSDLEAQRPTREEIELSLGFNTADSFTEDIPDLHLGTLDNVTVVSTEELLEPVIIIYPQTYLVNFTVNGLAEGTRYDFSVSDEQFIRTLENQFTVSTDPFYYTRWAITERLGLLRSMSTSMTIYNLTEDKVMPFVLSDATTTAPFYNDDLIEMIEMVYATAGQTVDFDTTREFDILLNFQGDLLISITVNGWVYKLNEENL